MKRICVITLAALAAACSDNPEKIAGTAADSPNAFITGVCKSAAGTPAAGIMVQAYPQDFNPAAENPDDRLIDTTGSDGAYRIGVYEPGTYRVEAQSDTLGFVATGLVVPDGGGEVAAAEAVLQPSGAVAGLVARDERERTSVTDSLIVRLKGRDQWQLLDPAGDLFSFGVTAAGACTVEAVAWARASELDTWQEIARQDTVVTVRAGRTVQTGVLVIRAPSAN